MAFPARFTLYSARELPYNTCPSMIHLRLRGCNRSILRFLKSRPNGTRNISSLSLSSSAAKPYYITTPIFYPNAAPHIGHLYSLVAADVFARYERLRRGSNDVRFLAGTDEHGMKIQKAARVHFGQIGREKEFCDALSERFRDLSEKANISNTCFMRTTSQEHRRTVEDVWRRLDGKGFIYKGKYEGWYSITDECFYTDAQVTTDPSGTQKVSVETGAVVEWTSEENYMFRLSAFRDALRKHYITDHRSVQPSQYREDVLRMLGDDVLEDISISRPRSRLEWGVQVPADPSQTVYVWFDALLIYLTGAGYPDKSFWPADLQVIGKDILRFHAIYLPAILLGLSTPHSYSPASPQVPAPQTPAMPLAHTLLSHAHWTSGQKKMSKSLGNVADPLEVMDEWGVDVVRYYMMRVGGKWRDDADWSTEQLEKHHNEIQSLLGNYFLRITSKALRAIVEKASPDPKECLSAAAQGRHIPPIETPKEEHNWDTNTALLRDVFDLPSKFHACMNNFEAGKALEHIVEVLSQANLVLTTNAPWATPKSDDVAEVKRHANFALGTRVVGLETLRVVAGCLEPFMPDISNKVQEALGVEGGVLRLDAVANRDFSGGERLEEFWARWKGMEVQSIKLFGPRRGNIVKEIVKKRKSA
ncbi:unnamed protein product [Cyclocybe aegerita]|uniref:Probable methionine--tRNA ligase, mitochondrial n=1 Tax=Cyclocybe aegerita TaxID=1973307 RepID=A0A8S0W3B5_CYCAE|nr:unnamed protein product [Cyclocybe aegerita]